MNNTKAICDLTTGDHFTMSSTHGTVYTVESVRVGAGQTMVFYHIRGDFKAAGMFTKPSLTTATLTKD